MLVELRRGTGVIRRCCARRCLERYVHRREVVTVELRAATTIERPLADVWHWYAVEHVRNHPRWDPDMQLEKLSEGPIGPGTRIRRRNTRWGTPIEGEMEVVAWEPERVFGVRIHDENMEMSGRVTFEAVGPDRTSLSIVTDIPGLDKERGRAMTQLMDRSADNIRQLAESDIGTA
jgi:hypothetical protein